MIDLGKAYKAQCEAALDAFRKRLNELFEQTTATLEDAQGRCLKAIADADEQFMVAAEARVSGAGLAIANTVRQFVGDTPMSPQQEWLRDWQDKESTLAIDEHFDKAAE